MTRPGKGDWCGRHTTSSRSSTFIPVRALPAHADGEQRGNTLACRNTTEERLLPVIRAPPTGTRSEIPRIHDHTLLRTLQKPLSPPQPRNHSRTCNSPANGTFNNHVRENISERRDNPPEPTGNPPTYIAQANSLFLSRPPSSRSGRPHPYLPPQQHSNSPQAEHAGGYLAPHRTSWFAAPTVLDRPAKAGRSRHPRTPDGRAPIRDERHWRVLRERGEQNRNYCSRLSAHIEFPLRPARQLASRIPAPVTGAHKPTSAPDGDAYSSSSPAQSHCRLRSCGSLWSVSPTVAKRGTPRHLGVTRGPASSAERMTGVTRCV